MVLSSLLVLSITLILSIIMTPLVRNYVVSRGILDIPIDNRRIHVSPVPRFGGVAVFVSFLLVALVIPFIFRSLLAGSEYSDWWMARLLLPISLMFLLGLIDDLLGIRASLKFILQIAIAVVFVILMKPIETLTNPFTGDLIELHWIGYLVTILWLVGITNAFNLIDGMDGLASGSALFTAFTMICIAMMNNHLGLVLVLCALSGAILGFLRYNFNPATIFLGDSGSLCIGFTLAALSILGTQKSTTLIALAGPIFSCGFPIFETFLSIMRRLLTRQPIFKADRRHIHHQLLAKGLSHRQVVLMLYSISALFAMFGLLLSRQLIRNFGILLLLFSLILGYIISQLGYEEFNKLVAIPKALLRMGEGKNQKDTKA